MGSKAGKISGVNRNNQLFSSSKAGKGVSPGQSKAMTGATIGPGSISGANERVLENIERIATNAARRNKPEFRNLNPEMVDSFQQRNPRRYGNPSQPLPSYTLANAPGGRPLLSNAPGGYPDPYQPFNLNILPPSYLNPERLETYPGYIPRDPILPNTAPPGIVEYFEEENDIPPSFRKNQISTPTTQNFPGGIIDNIQNFPGGIIDEEDGFAGFDDLVGILSLLNRR